MSLWGHIAGATEQPGGPLHGLSPGNVVLMLQTVGIHSNMRRISSGEACSLSQRRMLRRQLCAAFDVVSEAQYQCLLTLFDIGLAANGPDVSVGYLSAPYEPLAALGRKSFACNRVVCCNRQLKVSCTTATVYERDVLCNVARYVVKRCVKGCGSIYYLNKRVVSDQVGGGPCCWHILYAWAGGQVPASFHDMERNIAHVTLVYCCSRAANLELSVTAHNSITGERLSP
jgi:hypothetical protein